MIKNIFTSKSSKNASLLQKMKNKIPSCTFTIKAILSVSDKIKLVVYGGENA